jgi:hypothetical protein
MAKFVPLLLLLAACTQTPAPKVETAPPPRNVTRYTLYGIITASSDCATPVPSEVHMRATLSNAEHSVTTPALRVGIMGRSYTMVVEWNNTWGQPASWHDMVVGRLDDQPLCPGAEVTAVDEPVTGKLVRRDLTIRCRC